MSDRSCSTWTIDRDRDLRPKLTGQCFNDAGSESSVAPLGCGGQPSDAIVTDGQFPTAPGCNERYNYVAMTAVGKSVFEGIDHKFRNDQTEVHRFFRFDCACSRRSRYRNSVILANHRASKAVAQLAQIGPEFDLLGKTGCAQLPLNCGHKDQAFLHIAQKFARLFGVNGASLHLQDACNDLKAIGNSMMNFQKEHLLPLEQGVFQFFGFALRGQVFEIDKNRGI
jgi:hypothetical protein